MALFEVPIIEEVRRVVTYKVEAFSQMHACTIAEKMTSQADKVEETVITREVDRKSINSKIPAKKGTSPVFQLNFDDDIRDIGHDISFGKLKIVTSIPDAFWDGKRMKIGSSMLRLLVQMASNPGKSQTYTELLLPNHQYPEETTKNVLANSVKLLRKWLKRADPDFNGITNISSLGYRWDQAENVYIPDFTENQKPILFVDLEARAIYFCGKMMRLTHSQMACLSMMGCSQERLFDNSEISLHGCPVVDPTKDPSSSSRTVIKHIRRAASAIYEEVDLIQNQYGIGTRINPAVKTIVNGNRQSDHF
jgi:DNA-binding response OmpR family regulator